LTPTTKEVERPLLYLRILELRIINESLTLSDNKRFKKPKRYLPKPTDACVQASKKKKQSKDTPDIPITCLVVKDVFLLTALRKQKMGVERTSRTRILERLEREAQSLRKETDRIRDRRKKNLTFNRYLKLVSRIEEIKKSTSIELARYE